MDDDVLTPDNPEENFQSLIYRLQLSVQALEETKEEQYIRNINSILMTILINNGMSVTDAHSFLLGDW